MNSMNLNSPSRVVSGDLYDLVGCARKRTLCEHTWYMYMSRAVEGCLGAVGVGLAHACVVRGY